MTEEIREPEGFPMDLAKVRDRRQQEAEARKRAAEDRREQVFALSLAGLSNRQIAQRVGMEVRSVKELKAASLQLQNSLPVAQYRTLENLRLDRVQAAIWPKVLAGDTKAIDTFLRISQRRARLNGLDAPLDVSVSVSIRHEMQTALEQLEQVVLGQVIQGEVISDGDSS